ncbi:sulfotransferase [Burkholderia diffusa]|uniref:sulfotransferase family protein n=1 Tax=Burkholderia diffusa TaxID=488732 RepID=UPI00075AB61B|nr:sulfotransferase [Burkholderia diffusa]KWF83509.1 sulfotransferase [Burkholderia diffusa]
MNVHFITGLPRAGSTLLSVLLAQNPRFHAAIASPLFRIVAAMRQAMSAPGDGCQFMSDSKRLTLFSGIFDSYYGDARQAGNTVIFDSNRSWLQMQSLTSAMYPDARVIVCVRGPNWIVDSFEQLFRTSPGVVPKYFADAFEARSIYSRADALMRPDRLIGGSWNNVREAFYGPQSEQLMIVEYTALAADPEATLRAIYDFIGEPFFEHWYWGLDIDVQADIDRCDHSVRESGSHRVGSEVRWRMRPTLLPPELYERLGKMAFWRDVNATNAKVLLGPLETTADGHSRRMAEQ